MNISYNWLKDYLDFTLAPAKVSEALTSIGLETDGLEEVESIKGGLKGLVIGKVLTCEPHPDSDHLHITTVDLGDGQPTQIVCGAANVAAGQTVVVATVGTTLYSGDESFKIKKSKIRGVESLGMICAEDEIGTGTSHDGIIVIPENEAPKPGTPAAEYFKLESDWVMEVDLTPNRIDAASHYGAARDLAAYLDCHLDHANLHRPSVDAFAPDSADGAVTVEVLDTEGAPRYSGVTIRGVKVAESPEWLRNRLEAIGVRSINNIVDITNYILHGFGQPLHCFDLNKVKDNHIVVRTVEEGTPFVTLDGVERKLSAADVMICDSEKPLCIAGVFGGLDSGVTTDTTDIFLESATFHPTRIRRTARRHGLSTDASFRYERGLDPNATIYALKLAALMVKEMAGGRICGDIVDIYPEKAEPYKVDLSYSYLNNLVGKEIPEATVDSILKSLEIEITGKTDGVAHLLVPRYRVDVTRPCDVVEDVLRIYGYNNVEFTDTVHSSLQFRQFTAEADRMQLLIAEQLTAQGFNEILNNSLTAERYFTDLDAYPADNCVKLLNPLSTDLNVMRQTLLFGGLESLAHNINRKAPDLAFYEFGHVYSLNPAVESTTEKPLAPYTEGSRLALWLTGDMRQANWARPAEEATFFDLKGAVANILARLGISASEITLKPTTGNNIFATALTIATRSGKELGQMGVVAKSQLAKLDIKQPVMYAQLDWDAICKLAVKKKTEFTPLPKTMPVKRDLALLVDKAVTMAQIEATVQESERKLLRSIELFDVYEGKNLPAGKKSYAISITLQDDEKTLQDKQIDAVMAKVTANLARKLGAELR